MRKILASILAITMLMTTLSACVIPVQAETTSAAVALPFEAFTENFNGYAKENWIGKLDGNKVAGVDNMTANTWQIFGNGFTADNSFVGIVDDPETNGTRDKVLRIDVNSMEQGTANGKNWIQVRRNVNGGEKITRANLSTGKKLVVEVDSYMPTSKTASYESPFMRWSTAKTPGGVNSNVGLGVNTYEKSAGKYAIMTGSGYGKAGFARSGVSGKGVWETTKFIIDTKEDPSATHFADTARMIIDGKLQTALIATEAKEDPTGDVNPAINAARGTRVIDTYQSAFTALSDGTLVSKVADLYGFVFGNSTEKEGTAVTGSTEYYIDNLKIYWIDAFKQEGTVTYGTTDEAGNWYKDAIAIPFNNVIDDEVVVHEYAARQAMANNTPVTYTLTDLVTVKDAAGNKVAGATATVSADGKTLLVTPPKGLTAGETCSIVVDTRFSDENGQGLWISGSADETKEIATFVVGVDPYAHIIYDIDFDSEDLETGVNWIDNKDSNRYVTVKGLAEKAVTINQDPSAGAHRVEVVADPDPSNSDNKVLALTSAGTNGKVTKVRFNANGKDGIARSTMGKGKKLVYKVKIFLPEGYKGTESSALVNPSAETNYSANAVSGIGATIRTGESFYAATVGSWGTVMARSSTQTWQKPYETKGKWLEWKHVADVSKPLSPSHSDTVRAYIDNRLVASEVVNSSDPSTAFTANDKYSIVLGDTVIDYLANASKTDVLANGGSASIGDTWWGSHFTINPPSNAGDATYTYYIDDAEAYWIDALTMKDINANEYNGGKVVLEFNQRIREEVEYFVGKEVNNTNYRKLTLAELFNIVDSEGNVVEDGIAEVSISADGKKVYITPSDKLAKGVNYKIEISPYLIDEYGQGLENNSKASYVDLKISENYVPFTVTLSRDEISGFDSGRDNVKVTAKFSVAVDAENIENNIVVTNKATGAVATGWTYEFGATENGETDYTTVIFDFAGLEKADYTVKSTDDFAAVNAANLANALEITIKAAAGPIVLFDENFETGYAEGNLITEDKLSTSIPTNNTFRNYTIPAADGKGSWDIQLHSKAGAAKTLTDFADFFGVVDAPAEMGSGKVLKVANTRSTAYLSDYLTFRRNFDGDYNAYRFDEGQYEGKVLVYEADVYSPSVKGDTPFMQPSINKASIATYNEGIWKVTTNTSGSLSLSGGSYNSDFTKVGHGASWFRNNYLPGFKTATRKVRFVIDQATERDTMRLYVDGAMHTTPASQVAQLVNHPMNDPEGRYEYGPAIENTHMDNADQEWNMNTAKNLGNNSSIGDNKGVYGVYSVVSGAGTDANTEVVYYYDNFKAYLVDAFEIEEVTGYGNNYNTEKGRITFTFSKKVDETTATANKNIVVLDKDGNEVADGIESVTAKDGGYQLEVKLSETLALQTGYTVWVKAGLRDTDGLSLRTQYSYYLYDIDANYEKVAGTDNVYLITNVAGQGPIEATYTERVIENGKVTKPAYLTYSIGGKEYKAATDMYVKDYAKMKSKVEIITAKSNSLSATATPAVIADGKVTTTVTFSNPEVEAKSVWCVIAAFGDYNEMLGSAIVDVKEIEASTLTEGIEVSFETKAGKTVKTVKMFVWDNNKDMNAYQKAEKIWE